jgi:hypothetical protein
MSSELPQISNEKILQRLATEQITEINGLKERVAHLSLLAEALRDERDQARAELQSRPQDTEK